MVGEEAFSNRFADLYRLSLTQNCNIAELFVHQIGTSFQGWDLRFYKTCMYVNFKTSLLCQKF